LSRGIHLATKAEHDRFWLLGAVRSGADHIACASSSIQSEYHYNAKGLRRIRPSGHTLLLLRAIVTTITVEFVRYLKHKQYNRTQYQLNGAPLRATAPLFAGNLCFILFSSLIPVLVCSIA
jgi:hypothetical protein